MKVSGAIDKTSSFGSLLAALSCAGCFPALGSLGAALGLGFLAQYEGFLFRTLLPALAALALLVNAYAWFRQRAVVRGLLSIAGPAAVLSALLMLWHYEWSIHLFYAGLGLMLTTSIFGIVRPAKKPQCPA